MSVEATEQRAGDAGPPAINGLTREDFAFSVALLHGDKQTVAELEHHDSHTSVIHVMSSSSCSVRHS